ncbi:hypothetical protein OS189_08685 [Sulfitobacter sp. F26169L]|uniref:hypothetical protein n=1 Tax=Sulfitobacter sp. F26169L TaxID=2996015 RepID=UPI002260AEC6|nr:hypothetical protein [Sulfitobacter sp. F26169L]MCX7566416.1 hypothetical protein [Sulfitobacter sp. F26169L]
MILFFMSRKADDALVPTVRHRADKAQTDYPTSPRHNEIAPTHMPDLAQAEGGVTREEIIKLFGGALRVR